MWTLYSAQLQSTNMSCTTRPTTASSSFLVTPGFNMVGKMSLAASGLARLRNSNSVLGVTVKDRSRFFSPAMAWGPTHSTHCWIGPYSFFRVSCAETNGT